METAWDEGAVWWLGGVCCLLLSGASEAKVYLCVVFIGDSSTWLQQLHAKASFLSYLPRGSV